VQYNAQCIFLHCHLIDAQLLRLRNGNRVGSESSFEATSIRGRKHEPDINKVGNSLLVLIVLKAIHKPLTVVVTNFNTELPTLL